METQSSANRLPTGLHRYSQMERVHHGSPAAESLQYELPLLGARRVFVVTNRSLSTSPRLGEILSQGIGSRLVGRFDGVLAHAPRPCVIAGASAARRAGADLIVAIGGGSVIDAAKAMTLCIRYGLDQIDQIDSYTSGRPAEPGRTPDDAPQWLRVVAIPTTLSGAEFASPAGLTDTQRGLKESIAHPMMMPVSVILDPAMTLTAPSNLLLATGMKAVDHAVERVTTANANPFSDAVSLLALRLLAAALPIILERPDDLAARSSAQYGMFMSLAGSASGVAVNASHAIGHVLGAHAAVPHGETSCVLCPAVLRWSHDATADRQRLLCEALDVPGDNAGDAIAALVSSLSLPGRLRDVGVDRNDFPVIAAKTMHERLLKNSRKPISDAAEVTRILELAW